MDPRTGDLIQDLNAYCAYRPEELFESPLGPTFRGCARPDERCPPMILDYANRVWDILGFDEPPLAERLKYMKGARDPSEPKVLRGSVA